MPQSTTSTSVPQNQTFHLCLPRPSSKSMNSNIVSTVPRWQSDFRQSLICNRCVPESRQPYSFVMNAFRFPISSLLTRLPPVDTNATHSQQLLVSAALERFAFRSLAACNPIPRNRQQRVVKIPLLLPPRARYASPSNNFPDSNSRILSSMRPEINHCL